MRRLIALLLFVNLAACGGGGTSSGPRLQAPVNDTCSIDNQKQFVLDVLYVWYLWNDLLPPNISISDYSSPEELVARVTTELGPRDANDNPIDLFSSVGSAIADQQFFGEGRFEGFGFSWRFVGDNEFRLTRVFADSPAASAGLERGQRVLGLNGRSIDEIEAAEGVGAVFSANDTITVEVERVDGSVITPVITKDVVTIDPVPQPPRLIDMGPGVPPVGYLELTSFISTAEPEFETAFAAFREAGVTDLILDLRYNGGGLVRTADLLGDYLGAGIAPGEVFSLTEFNADRADNNTSTRFTNALGFQTINLSRLVVIATRNTASASELVTNGLIPYADVAIVGENTFGKPVGQIGLEFCEKIVRPTAFRLANADGDGDYFDGLPVTCPTADDLSVATGDPLDPNMIAAMSWLNTGACPAAPVLGDQLKGVAPPPPPVSAPSPYEAGRPEREFAGAY